MVELVALVVALVLLQILITAPVVVTVARVNKGKPPLNAAVLDKATLQESLAKLLANCMLAAVAEVVICPHKALSFPLAVRAVVVPVVG